MNIYKVGVPWRHASTRKGSVNI